MHPGKFYALPQAPQQFKQLLMVSGFDRYFQIAPCFRDEDARADRSPGEFYQLDMEMSFVTQDDVFAVVESVICRRLQASSPAGASTAAPFPRIPYREAMVKYGTDKPDLRIPIEMVDVSAVFRGSGFNAFRSIVEKGGVVRAIPVQGDRRPAAQLLRQAGRATPRSSARKGLAYLVWDGGAVKGPIAKFLDAGRAGNARRAVRGRAGGDVVFFVCDTRGEADAHLRRAAHQARRGPRI